MSNKCVTCGGAATVYTGAKRERRVWCDDHARSATGPCFSIGTRQEVLMRSFDPMQSTTPEPGITLARLCPPHRWTAVHLKQDGEVILRCPTCREKQSGRKDALTHLKNDGSTVIL